MTEPESERVAPYLPRPTERLYQWIVGREPPPDIREGKPTPIADLSGRKVDVLLALHASTMADIEHWEERIFRASVLTAGALISAVLFVFQQKEDLVDHRVLVAVAIAAFGVFSWLYLVAAVQAFGQNGLLKAKVEAALGLCEKGRYLKGRPFFGYSAHWQSNHRALVILAVHGLIVVLAPCSLAFL